MFSFKKHNWLLWALPLWSVVVAAGVYWIAAYANQASAAGSPPLEWPRHGAIKLGTSEPTLLMFVHPHCPCSRASIGELAELMAHCQGRVNAAVLFVKPQGSGPDWASTDLWGEAARIPGVRVMIDDKGATAQLFQVATSGDTVLYSAEGHLLFHGGVTTERGHYGDSPGGDALEALIYGKQASLTNTPVYGCGLFECSSNEAP